MCVHINRNKVYAYFISVDMDLCGLITKNNKISTEYISALENGVHAMEKLSEKTRLALDGGCSCSDIDNILSQPATVFLINTSAAVL